MVGAGFPTQTCGMAMDQTAKPHTNDNRHIYSYMHGRRWLCVARDPNERLDTTTGRVAARARPAASDDSRLLAYGTAAAPRVEEEEAGLPGEFF